jgi:anti-sigma-K factor RskA
MRYDDAELQDALASEYVLGILRGAARRRCEALMVQRPALRHRIEWWEERMFPLMVRAPRVKAPERLWKKIHARVSPRAAAANTRRAWWTGFASAGVLCAALLLWLVGVSPPVPVTMVAVLHDAQAQPAILASWTARQAAEGRIALRILAHPDMPPDTSWQAWLIRDDGGAPVSLGLITVEPQQLLSLSAGAVRALPSAAVIGVSVEPKGGSTSGRPGGGFVFQGPVLRVDG